METLKIGIITIGVGLLSLIYPLTHIYLINLLRDLHSAWQIVIEKCKSEECQVDRQKILSFQTTVGYIVNIFLLSGLLLIFIFIILMFQYEEVLVLIWLIRILILIFIILSIWISKREIPRNPTFLKWVAFIMTLIIYLYLFYLSCIRCEGQLYSVLLWLGILMAFQILYWFLAGIIYTPTVFLRNLREKIYEECKLMKSKIEEDKNNVHDSTN